MARTNPKRQVVAALGAYPSEPPDMRPPIPLTRSVSLRWRVTLLAASVVAIAVAVTSIAAYALVARALYANVDTQLRSRANGVIASNPYGFNYQNMMVATAFYPDTGIALIWPDLK